MAYVNKAITFTVCVRKSITLTSDGIYWRICYGYVKWRTSSLLCTNNRCFFLNQLDPRELSFRLKFLIRKVRHFSKIYIIKHVNWILKKEVYIFTFYKNVSFRIQYSDKFFYVFPAHRNKIWFDISSLTILALLII